MHKCPHPRPLHHPLDSKATHLLGDPSGQIIQCSDEAVPPAPAVGLEHPGQGQGSRG